MKFNKILIPIIALGGLSSGQNVSTNNQTTANAALKIGDRNSVMNAGLAGLAVAGVISYFL
ncbi:hypothetical protein NCAS_0B00970 [Naumovozyma castellii]|uniref:Uncharacterized protein n=1 Tax=Naumovozyma castellii TaxID=27288 RepID=G0VB57_NAUCA|nr:hypothetical protein NCAS_0B00970 [Naumovozyma castellii CBS 4309]CCC68181.1 hypothetical protein NCAS_0B00970 [Naumovozyma castellii CBS 4309]